jgi:hypothetical protein
MTILRIIPLVALISALFIFGGGSDVAARILGNCPPAYTQCAAACDTKNSTAAQTQCRKRCWKNYCAADTR